MNTKTQYLLSSIAVVFALMFVVATPYAVAESDAEKNAWHEGKKDMMKDSVKHNKKHMDIQVEGFVGSIPIPEEMNREAHNAIKDQITVSLSEAAAGLDVMNGGISIAVNENGEKFVVWKLVSMDMSDDSKTITKTIHIIDAGNAENTETITKEFDPSKKMEKYHKGEDYGERHAKKIEKLEQKLSQLTGDAELDQIRAQFLALIQELRDAHANGDTERAHEIQNQLHELRTQLGDVRRF